MAVLKCSALRKPRAVFLTHWMVAFTASRPALVSPDVNWPFAAAALVENAIYFALGLAAFNLMFARSRNTGQFARNEG